MRIVGIIGGLGPETTAKFYLEIVFGCYRKNKTRRPPVLMWSVPLEYKVEEELLKNALGEERYLPYLVDAAKRLEKGGADFLAMPCNSLHIFVEEIRKSVKIPVLSIIEETTKFLKARKETKVGILATETSLKAGLYQTALEEEGMEQVLPDELDQAKIGKIISNLVLNRQANSDRKKLLEIIEKFEERGVKSVILACTDLQLLIPAHTRLEIHDTMKIFAESTVREILKQ